MKLCVAIPTIIIEVFGCASAPFGSLDLSKNSGWDLRILQE